MHHSNYSTVAILSTYLLLNYVITRQSITSYHLMDESYDKGNILTTNIKDYKELFRKKIEYIRENRGMFLPANEDILQKIQDKINKSSFDLPSVFATQLNMPGNQIGYYPVTPYNDTTKMVCFQLEQGSTGWYWLYGTFPNTKDCFLYELMRVDLLPTELREKLGYKLGETTIYVATLGIGNGSTYYYGNVYFEGTLLVQNNVNFSITSKDGSLQFTHMLNNITISCKNIMLTNNKNPSDKIMYTFSCQTKNNYNMFFNQENGCIPCDIGNNSYQSYTNLYLDMSYSNSKGITKTVENGFGWMDHEWGSGQIQSVADRMILTILNKGKIYNGLPPYIWLNIRLSDNLQYMIWSFFDTPPKKGDIVYCSNNKYEPSRVDFFDKNDKIPVKIIETVNNNNTDYPIIYEVTIDDVVYTLDSRPYGETIFLDVGNTNHWGGSCDVLVNNHIVGTGFLEAQRFDGDITCLQQNFKLMGIDPSEKFAETYYNTRNTTQLVFAYVLFVFMFSLLFILFYRFVKSLYHFMKKSYATIESKTEKNLYLFLHLLFFVFIVYLTVLIIMKFTRTGKNGK